MTAKLATALALLLAVAAPALAENRDVTIVNETSTAMVHFYASNTGAKDWQEDILDVDILEAGDVIDVTIDDGSGACLFDFKATFDDGLSATKAGVDVCQISTFSFTE